MNVGTFFLTQANPIKRLIDPTQPNPVNWLSDKFKRDTRVPNLKKR